MPICRAPVAATLLLAVFALAGPALAATTPDPGWTWLAGSTPITESVDGAGSSIADPPVTRLGMAPSALQWQGCFGGTDRDRAFDIDTTADGGAIVAAISYSSDGDLSREPGASGLWVFRVDAAGALLWQEFLDGGGYQSACVQQTVDGGFIVAGHGGYDLWVLKLDSAGVLQWENYLGGQGYEEEATSVQQTADGGYIVAGSTGSYNDGDVAGAHGGTDAWVVKLDAAGALQWQRCLGGTGDDRASCTRQTGDGGYVVAGYTFSDDGDFAGSHGSGDAWIAKLDAAGTLVWRRCLGGSWTEYASAVRQTADHGYIVAGSTGSNDGDVSGSHGPWQRDAWVVKLTPTGGLSWQRCLGGNGTDEATGVEQTADGGYVVAGTTESNDGDVAGNHGMSDLWVVKLDASGAPARQECLGGTDRDQASALDAARDGGFLLAGWTCSNDGDVTGYHWGLDRYDQLTDDVWVVKLTADAAPFLVKVPGALGLPTDPDTDGLYEDVNGNGRADFADVVLYFNRVGWIAANEEVRLLDFNANGGVDFADVIWLFNRL